MTQLARMIGTVSPHVNSTLRSNQSYQGKPLRPSVAH